MDAANQSEKVVRLASSNDGNGRSFRLDWMTLIVSLVLSIAGGTVVTSFQAGRTTEKLEDAGKDIGDLSLQVKGMSGAIGNLSTGVATLSAQVSALKDSIGQERQDRIDAEHRLR